MKRLHPVEWIIFFALCLLVPVLIGGCFKLCVEKDGSNPPAVSGSVTLPATITINQTQPATQPH